jgi:serine/threonine-protein kinase
VVAQKEPASPSAATTTPEPQSNVTRAAPPSDASATALVHTALDLEGTGPRYDVKEELGRGGMGEVHLCWDRRIGRLVARKRRAKGSAELKRFLREASVQGQLEHPTIVPLHDLALDEDGELYFTMKAIRGRTLKPILAARRDGDAQTLADFPIRKLLKCLANVCLGVAFAHSRGVVHRDLKPDNLMLGEFGEVYVLDWGVAKLKAAGAADDELMRVPLRGSVTKIGSMIGTAGYMSPEQCTGEVAVDERSDIYSLGAILFEILAGEPLHSGTPLEKIDATLAGVDVRERAVFWPREMLELANVCAQATTLAATDRLRSARELAEAIERSLDRQAGNDLPQATAPAKAEGDVVSGVVASAVAPVPDADSHVRRTAADTARATNIERPPTTRLYMAGAATLVAVSTAHALATQESPLWIGVLAVSLALLTVAAWPRRGGRRERG